MAITKELMTLARVSEDTGIARTTLYSHIARGHLKTEKIGFYTVVSAAELAAFKKRLKRVTFGDRTVTVFQ